MKGLRRGSAPPPDQPDATAEVARLRERVKLLRGRNRRLREQVAARSLDPYRAAEALLDEHDDR